MRRIVLVLCLGALFATVHAQDPTFSSSTNLVVVDVSVKDKSGKVVPNLTKNDFTVLEDGKPQQVSIFEFQRLDFPDIQRKPVPAVKAAPAESPGPQRTTSGAVSGAPRPIIRFQDRRLVAMLFDFSTMAIPEQSRVQEAAMRFLREQMKTADLICIMTASTGPLKIVQDFTDDRDRLEEVIKSFQIGVASELSVLGSNGDTTTGEDTGTAFDADETEFNIFNTDRKLATLESAAKMLSTFPEKKALLYFSSGVNKSGFDNQASLEAAVNAAKRSNVAFYPIDARGLQAAAPLGDASSAASRGTSMFSGVAQQGQRDTFNDSQETLSTLAADTGGKLFVDDNDLALGMSKARDDISSYYILGYYSTNSKMDGKYRRVQVKFTHALDARLDYRSGYFGQKEFRKFTETDKEDQLQQALMLGDPLTDLSLTAEIDYFRLARDRYFVPFSVKIPGSEIALAKSKGAAATQFDFIGQVRDEHTKLVGIVRDYIRLKLAEQTAAQLSSRPIVYDTGFTLPPGKYSLKFLARENETGKMGTYHISFTVPDLAPDQSNILKTSSIVWSNQRQALQEAIASADKKSKLLESDPLVADGQKLVPSITHVFRKDQSLYVYLEVYDPGLSADKKPSVAATLAFYRGKTRSFESEPVRLEDFMPKRGQTLPVRFQAPLSQLVPGRYTCQVNLIDENGKRFAFRRADIVVLPASKS